MSGAAVDREDALDHVEVGEVADGRVELLAHLTDDSLAVGLTRLEAAADEPVVAHGVLDRRRAHADSVRRALGIRGDEHGLDPDLLVTTRHDATLSADHQG